MIKENIKQFFPLQFAIIQSYSQDIYVADYTNQTNNQRGVEIFSITSPNDIACFSVKNPKQENIHSIIFDNTSFVRSNGNARSQCECVIFPEKATQTSWILFCELKYSSKERNNEYNIERAIKQVLKTWCYYKQQGVITKTNTSYLVVSLPKQREPFPNFTLTQGCLKKQKKKRNIVLKLTNSVKIKDTDFLI